MRWLGARRCGSGDGQPGGDSAPPAAVPARPGAAAPRAGARNWGIAVHHRASALPGSATATRRGSCVPCCRWRASSMPKPRSTWSTRSSSFPMARRRRRRRALGLPLTIKARGSDIHFWGARPGPGGRCWRRRGRRRGCCRFGGAAARHGGAGHGAEDRGPLHRARPRALPSARPAPRRARRGRSWCPPTDRCWSPPAR